MVVVRRKAPRTAAFLIPLLAACTVPTAVGEWAGVDRVIDGDTLVLRDGERVRLLGLDAPEMGSGGASPECFAPEAKAFLDVLVVEADGQLRLQLDEVEFDRYGRRLAYLWDRQGRMLNEEILREGYARYYPAGHTVKWKERLRVAEEEARLSQRGLWHPDACP